MIRIKADRCGYTGYTCTAVQKLNPIFTNTEFSYDPVPGHITGLDVSQLDNYLNIPELMEGFVMTLPQIPDMEAAKLEVPELSCRIDFDPFSDEAGATKNETKVGGFMDFYQLYTASEKVITAEVEGGTIASYALQTTLPYFETDYILQPGLLEPMVDTSFAPVPIDQITAPEAGNNGNLLAIGMLQKWRTLVNGRINDLYRKVRSTFGEYDAAGLRDMLNKQNKKSPCANFTMTRTSGQNVIKVENPDRPNIPMYSISGGTVYVDGTKVEVSGYTESGHTTTMGMFTAYLEIKGSTVDPAKPYVGTVKVITGNTVSETLSPLPKNTEDTYNFLIGGLRLIPPPENNQDPDYSGGTKFKLYELVVGDCLENIELSGGTGGSTTSWQYNGPFQVVGGTVTGSVKVTGVDSVVGSTVTYAGYICYNGTDCDLEPEASVDISGGSARDVDIYANIGAGKTVSFDTAPGDGTPKPYSVRLARVSGYKTIYNIELGASTSGATGKYAAGQAVAQITDAYPNGHKISGTDKEWIATAGGTAYRIYGVTNSVYTGRFIEGGTATVMATDTKDIRQFHFGDIYVDGRWS